MKNLLLLCLVILFTNYLFANELTYHSVKSKSDWNKVQTLSKESQKPIMLAFHAKWCFFCKKMEKEIFTNQSVADFYNTNFINAIIDPDTEFGKSMVSKHKINGYPSFVFFDQSSRKLKTSTGFQSVEQFINIGKSVSNLYSGLPQLEKKYKLGSLSMAEMRQYIELIHDDDPGMAYRVANEYIDKLPEDEYTLPENWPIVKEFGLDVFGRPFNYIKENHETLLYKELREYFDNVVKLNLTYAIDYQDTARLAVLCEHTYLVSDSQFMQHKLCYDYKKKYLIENDELDEFVEMAAAFSKVITEDIELHIFYLSEAHLIIKEAEDEEEILIAVELLDLGMQYSEMTFQSAMVYTYAYAELYEFDQALEYSVKRDEYLKQMENLAKTEQEIEDFEAFKLLLGL